jgi:C-terminal processing protease CtpA/Prc
MKTRLFQFLAVLVVLSLVQAACSSINLPQIPGIASQTQAPGTSSQPQGPGASNQPYQITGSFTYTNTIITTYYVENAVALVDMYGFVKRDQTWVIPVSSQTLGFLSIDSAKKTGKYTLQLPAKPTGQMVNVSNDGKQDPGVQVFAVSYWPNLAGGPYSEGDDPSQGWPNYLASVITDSNNKDEVIGGNLVVWSPDGNQSFPTGFGADHKLFSADDPVGPIPAGYSIVNLDKEPFTVSQIPTPSLTLFEPKDAALKDFSSESYTKAFDDMFNIVKLDYAFNGISGKQPNWDQVYSQIQPRVAAAESNHDPNAFYLALRDFTAVFKDAHVGLDGGQYGQQDFTKATSGGYGLAIRQLDDGSYMVIYVLSGGPADQASIKVGALVTQFNGQPIRDAVAATHTFSNQSSDFAIQYQQARYLLSTAPGTQAKVTFTDPGGQSQTATLTAVAERNSFARTSLYYGVNTDPLLPVDYKIIDQGASQIGYIIINSNDDDLNLIVRLFQRALQQFQDRKVNGLIIDMRYNSGGAPLGLEGFLNTKDVVLGQLEYYSTSAQKFQPEGVPQKFTANVEQYHFDKMALLVGPACFSACELDAYGFSQVPGMMVVGQYPSAGAEAEVSRGQFILPESMSLQIPFGRFVLPDGSLFLEGQGVKPTIKVPIDTSTAVSTDDVVLKAVINAVLGASTSIQPTPAGPVQAASGAPKIADQSTAKAAFQASAPFLENKATEKYQASDFANPGKLTYTVSLSSSDQVVWDNGWCATTSTILAANLKSIQLKFTLDGKDVPLSDFVVDDSAQGGQQCHAYYTALSNWPVGQHHLTSTLTMTSKINDGTSDYVPGDYVLDYTVNVQP